MKNRIFSQFIILLALVVGAQTHAAEQKKSKSIWEIIKINSMDSSFTWSQDAKGNRVAYRDKKYAIAAGDMEHPGVMWTEIRLACENYGGKFYLLSNGPSNLSRSPSPQKLDAIAAEMDSNVFWQRHHLPFTSNLMSVGAFKKKGRGFRGSKYEYMYDPAIRNGKYGTFVCADAASNQPRWVYNGDFYHTHKGYTSAGGNYHDGFSHSVYQFDTFIIYEQQKFEPYDRGIAKLPKSSDGQPFPSRGYYVVIENTDGRWRTISTVRIKNQFGPNMVIAAKAPRRQKSNQEVLVVSEDGNYVVPAYQDEKVEYEYGTTRIGRNSCHKDELTFQSNYYTVCSSAFTDAPQDNSIGTHVLATLFAKDPNVNYRLKQERTVSFMEEKFRQIVSEAGVQMAVRQTK